VRLLSQTRIDPDREGPVIAAVNDARKATPSPDRYGTGMAVYVRMLGGLEITRDGAPAALPTRKAQALLARLALRPGEPVPRVQLAGLLWGGVPDEQGRASLRQAIASIRRAVGDVVAGGDAIAAHVESDAAELAVAADPERVGRLYRGALLDGFPPLEEDFDGWLEEARAALARRALEALRALLDGPAADVALADRALAIDSTFEPAWRARIRLLAARGERAAALREAERCRAELARSVRAAPSAETERLVREVASAGPEPAPRGGRAPALAVLPFEVLSGDPTHALFARGLAEDVLVALSRFRPLRVAARDSAWRLAGEGLAAAAVGRVLAVDYVLSASVRPGAGGLRIAAHLVEVAGEREVWGERYDAELADLLGVQDRLVRAVASALVLHIDSAGLREASRRPPERLDAWECWLRGMECLRAGTAGSDLEGRRFFERALEKDPGFARAYAGLSLSHFNDWSCVAWDRWDENERRAFDYAREALRLDDRDHVAHLILGRVLLYRREFDAAAEHLARSLALNDNDADALAHLALGLAYLGEPERAIELGAAARRLNPFHPDWYFPCIALGHAGARRLRPAVELLERAPDGFVDTRALLAALHGHCGDVARAGESARRFLDRFRREIARDPRAGAAEAVPWLLRINPLRRAEDRDWLVDGLARAGVGA
jgi:TolB-like protein